MDQANKGLRSRLYDLGQEDAKRDFDRDARRKGTSRRPWWSRGYLSTIKRLESEDRRARRAVA